MDKINLIKEFIYKKGISQKKLAEQLGYTPIHLNRILRRHALLSEKFVEKFRTLLQEDFYNMTDKFLEDYNEIKTLLKFFLNLNAQMSDK